MMKAATQRLLLGLLVMLGSAASGQDQPGAGLAVSVRPHARLAATGLKDVEWRGGFWGERFDLCQQVVLPEMKKALLDPENSACLSNFRVGAGLEAGGHRGTNWSDGDCYKWIEAMALVRTLREDESFDREMDYWIDLIARTQAADGYIGTQTQLNPQKKRWSVRHYHELYNMGHLLTTASVHHQATGKDTFLVVATKLADHLERTFGPKPKELGHFGWNPSNIMGLVDLYRITGNKRDLDLAGLFVSMRGSVKWPPMDQWGESPGVFDPHPGDQTQDRVALRKETQAVGHAVTGAYLYAGAADVVAETGEKALLDALLRIEQDVATRKEYITGGTGAYHNGLSPRGDKIHEAFGTSYDLPNRTAYNETCANIANAMWNYRMLLLTGDAQHADTVERVLYNSMLSAMNLEGTRFHYTNPLARSSHAELLSHDAPERWFVSRCYCCPPSVARTLARLQQWAYATTPEGVYVLLYGSNSLQTRLGEQAVRLEQETDYPWDGRVKIRVIEAPSEKAFALSLRIPGWANSASLRINGDDLEVGLGPGRFAPIQRVWKAGDVVELNLPMEPVLMEANPLLEQSRGQVAVMRGPLVYCLESADLPAGVTIANVCLKRRASWKANRDPGLLGNAVVLETKVQAKPNVPWTSLYRPVPREEPREVAIKLVPYFAWNNRGPGEMAVWLPVGE